MKLNKKYLTSIMFLICLFFLSFKSGSDTQTHKTAAELFPLPQFKEMLGLKELNRPDEADLISLPIETVNAAKIPISWDWRKKGIMTPVRNQGSCGGCWAFASIGVFESLIKWKSKVATDLSEQELINCDIASSGCSGGWPSNAMKYMKNSGIVLEEYYPYRAATGSCDVIESTDYHLNNYADVNIWNDPLKDRIKKYKYAIYNAGPVATGMKIYSDFYYKYRSGVYIYDGSSGYIGGHAIVIVGWVDDPSITNGGYWICKNSWGKAWGESGYFQIGYGQAEIDRWFLTYGIYNPAPEPSPNNRPPVFKKTIGSITLNENENISFFITATDPDGDKLKYMAVPIPDSANFLNDTGFFSWKTDYNSAGIYDIVFTATDGKAYVSQTARVTIVNINRPPAFINEIGNPDFFEGQKIEFSVAAEDPDGDQLIYHADHLPAGAQINSRTGLFSWTPDYKSSGIYIILFLADDGSLKISQQVILTIKNYKRTTR